MKKDMVHGDKNKGFTLAELLIVVAIIAVLVAVAIPVFTAQLNKAKYATNEANARAVYAELVADYLSNGVPTYTVTCGDDEYGNDEQIHKNEGDTMTITLSSGSSFSFNETGHVIIGTGDDIGHAPYTFIENTHGYGEPTWFGTEY